MSNRLRNTLPAREDKRSWLRKIAEFLHPGPDSKDELIEALSDAHENHIIGSDSRDMLEGVIRMSELAAGDVMVPLARMDSVNIHAPFEEILNGIIDTGHSRFPVHDGSRENILGILLAKDLLKMQRAPELNLRALLRPAAFIPESKGLNDLLREFRGARNHLAIVVDEFGRVAGLITIEDVLEQIVGEIEDEFDEGVDDGGDIFGLTERVYRVAGDTAVERVESTFGVTFPRDRDGGGIETIGGWVAHEIGHVPQRGEQLTVCSLRFKVLHTKGGAVRWFRVEQLLSTELSQ